MLFLSQDNTGCTQLSSVTLEYRLSGVSTWTIMTLSASVSDREATIQLQRSGSYEVRLRVTNQGGVTTETQPKTVGVGGTSPINLLSLDAILCYVLNEPVSSEHSYGQQYCANECIFP